MSETPPTPPPEEQKPAPKADDEPAEKKDDLLDILEKDFIAKLKDKVELEDLASLDQSARIKAMRIMVKAFEKQEPPKKDEKPKKEEKPKGESVDPTAPPAAESNHIPTLLERNNLKDYRNDLQKKSSLLNVTNKLRGKS